MLRERDKQSGGEKGTGQRCESIILHCARVAFRCVCGCACCCKLWSQEPFVRGAVVFFFRRVVCARVLAHTPHKHTHDTRTYAHTTTTTTTTKKVLC